ncbi:MAG: GC-type dockerin domain-anchored protein [Planctomycetota bacterium]
MRFETLTAAAMIAALSGTAFGQAANWNNTVGGNWNDSSSWDPMVEPNGATFDVTLGLGTAYTLDLNVTRTIGSLTISNPLATLDILGSRSLTLDSGPLVNEGTILVNGPGSTFDSRLLFSDTTSITGVGEIVLGALSEIGGNADARIEAISGSTVTIGADQTIRGNGEIRGSGIFMNLGTILSEDPLGPGINVACPIDQTGGGVIDVANGIVSLSNGALISGGQLVGSGTGVLRVPGSPAQMTDFTINAPVEILGGSDQLELLGPIVNNNTITLNPNAAVFNAVLRFEANTSITGTGNIVMIADGAANDAQLNAAPGFTGTIGAGQTVTGRGQVNGDIVLEGSITATGDGLIDLAVFDTLSGSGTLAAADDARIAFNTATISDVTFDSSGNGIVAAVNGESFFDSVHIVGNAGIAGNGARFSLLGDITNDGTFTINYTDMVFNAVLDFETSATILGTGDIRMIASGSLNDAQIVTSDPAVGTFGAGQTVAGSGEISGTFVNNGTLDGDDPAASLRLSGTITGPGALESNGGVLEFQNVNISGQTLTTSGGGLVTTSNGVNSIADSVNNGDLGLNGNGLRLTLEGTFTNNGNILVNVTDQVFNAVLGVNTETPVGGTGSVVLETAGQLGDARIETENDLSVTFGPGQVVSGSGQLIGDITVQGSIDPDGDLRELNAQGGTLFLEGTSNFDLGGLANTEFDRITTGADQVVSLGGTIDVNLDPGYTPAFGDEWEIIGGSSSTVIEGSFDTYDLPAPPLSQVYRVFIEDDRVFVRLTCGADFNGDGLGNFFDISKFIELFNAGDPRVDLAAPFGALNFFDIATYIGIFNAGCN